MNRSPGSCVHHGAPLSFPLVRSEAAAWRRGRFRVFRQGSVPSVEGADAINGRARGLARPAITLESTGHAASVLELSCAIAGYC
jgi:hypothetical protein